MTSYTTLKIEEKVAKNFRAFAYDQQLTNPSSKP